jgi:hypothetical protein
MRVIYAFCLGAGWAYIAVRMHWPVSIIIVADIMTMLFAFYLSRVIEDDRRL